MAVFPSGRLDELLETDGPPENKSELENKVDPSGSTCLICILLFI